jgi:UDP-GlcNAc:undecaprenyl-phosphate GlcNAc-1-phosphate transferase
MLGLAGAVVLIVAFGLVAGLVPIVRAWARRRGFVDRPGGHKGHAAPVALGGGIAVTAALVMPVVAGALVVLLVPGWLPEALAVHVPGARSKIPQLAVITGGALALFAVGLWDDRRGVPATARFGVQLLVALGVWLAGVRVTAFVPLPGASLVLTVLWVAGITNAFNLLDNCDGLSSAVAAIAALMLAAALAHPEPQLFVIALLLLVAGASLGFLLHNRPPATIFLGDAGSTVLGYLLGVTTALATFYGEGGRTRAHAVAVPLLVLAVPLYDMASVVVLRLRRGVSPFVGDRNHFSHRLMRLGLSPGAAVCCICLVAVATGIGALLVDRVDAQGALLLLVQGGLILGIIATLEVAAARGRPPPDVEP